jgi:hypothetical protein
MNNSNKTRFAAIIHQAATVQNPIVGNVFFGGSISVAIGKIPSARIYGASGVRGVVLPFPVS